MNKLLLFTALILATGCGLGGSKKMDKKVIYGSWDDLTYKNPLFNLTIEFDENWDIKKDKKISSLTGFSFDATSLSSFDKEYPVNVNVNVAEQNGYTESTEEGELKSSVEMFAMMYESDELIIEPIAKVKIAGADYLLQKLTLIDDGDVSFVHQYIKLKDGYFMTFSITFDSNEDEELVLDFINGIKKIK